MKTEVTKQDQILAQQNLHKILCKNEFGIGTVGLDSNKTLMEELGIQQVSC